MYQPDPHAIALRRIAAIDAYLAKPSLIYKQGDASLGLHGLPMWQNTRFWAAFAPPSIFSVASFAAVQPVIGICGLAWSASVFMYFYDKKRGTAWEEAEIGGSDPVVNWQEASRGGTWLKPVARLLGQEDTCIRGVGAVVPEVLPGIAGVQAGRLFSFGLSIAAGQVWQDHEWYLFLQAPVPEICKLPPFIFSASTLEGTLPDTRQLADRLQCEHLHSWDFDEDIIEAEERTYRYAKWYGEAYAGYPRRIAERCHKSFAATPVPFLLFHDGRHLTWLASVNTFGGADSLAALVGSLFGDVNSAFGNIIACERGALLKNEVLLHWFESRLQDVSFHPGSVPVPGSYFESWLTPEKSWPACEDMVTGRFGEYWLQLFEVEDEDIRNLHLVIRGGYAVSSPVQILDTRSMVKPHLPLLDTAWEVGAFAQRYRVFGKDEVEARFALPVNLQERLVQIADRWQVVIDYTIREDEMHIAIRNTKDLFEPKFDVVETEALFRKQIDSILEMARTLRR